MTDDEFDARYVAIKALVEYANPLNWDVDENGIRRVWKEPGSETPEAYNGFELAKAAISTAAQPTEEPVAYLWQHSETGRTRVVMPDGVITADATWHVVGPLVLAAAPKAALAPAAQGDELPREDFAWLVVQEACETEPADEDDPECIRILRRDLKSAVLSAFLRHDAAHPAAPVAQGDARAEQALRKILEAIREYLPPDGPSANDTIAKIVELVDPWPLDDPKGKA